MRALGAIICLLFLSGTLSAGIVDYYTFNGNLNDSVGGNNGAVLAGSPGFVVPTTPVPGSNPSNRVLSLTTSDALSFNFPFPLDGTDATLEFWIDPNTSNFSTYGDHDIFWTNTSPGDINRFNIHLSDGSLGFDYRDAAGDLQGVTGTASAMSRLQVC
jgi:hypothetical protein